MNFNKKASKDELEKYLQQQQKKKCTKKTDDHG